jgi:hypothetical protein
MKRQRRRETELRDVDSSAMGTREREANKAGGGYWD